VRHTAKYPPEWQAYLHEERRQAREAAKAFAKICRENRPDELDNAALWLDEKFDAWRPAMALVAKLAHVSPEIQQAFIPVWVERKHLPLAVGDRRTTAAGLRVLMPGAYTGPPLPLYRGTGSRERRSGAYGFSWSTNIDIARKFAKKRTHVIPQIDAAAYSSHGHVIPRGAPLRLQGVLLRTVAPPEAVLLIREREDYYDEDEVVVDPYRLSKVALLEHLEPEEEKAS
jgi:hypothetical protein